MSESKLSRCGFCGERVIGKSVAKVRTPTTRKPNRLQSPIFPPANRYTSKILSFLSLSDKVRFLDSGRVHRTHDTGDRRRTTTERASAFRAERPVLLTSA